MDRARLARIAAVVLLAGLVLVGMWASMPRVAPSDDALVPRPAPATPAPEAPVVPPASAPGIAAPEPPAAEPEDSPDTWRVSCDIDLDADRVQGRVVTVDRAQDEVHAQMAIAHDGQVHFLALSPEGSGELTLDGYEPVRVRWVEWPDLGMRCAPIDPPLPLDGRIEGVVDGDLGDTPGAVGLEGCGVRPYHEDSAVDLSTGTFGFDVAARPCSLRAWRQAGALRVFTEPVELEPTPGDTVRVEFLVPDFEPAGIGIGLVEGEDAIQVTGVFAGSPADRAGLQWKDRILTVDGEPTAGMSVQEFAMFGTGPEGTEVELEVATGDDPPRTVVIVREILVDEDR